MESRAIGDGGSVNSGGHRETGWVESYKHLIAKIKKKSLLRRVPYAEAIEGLSQLMGFLKRENRTNTYAAFCCIAIGRCHQAMRDANMEAFYRAEGGHLLWTIELERIEAAGLNFEEDTAAAQDCYLLAIKVRFLRNPLTELKLYLMNKRNALAASLYVELADILKHLHKFGEAAHYFQQAADLHQNDSPLMAISALEEAVECYVKLRDYKSSCINLTWIMKLASEVNNLQGLSESEVNKNLSLGPNYSVYSKVLEESRIWLCLLLVLQGDFWQARDFVKKLVEDVSGCGVPVDASNEMIALLDALVTAVQDEDMIEVKFLSQELCQWVTPKQSSTMQLILEEVNYFQNLTSINII